MTGLEIGIIIVSVLLIAAILLQQRAAGLGSAFGSDTTVFTTRRGAEKGLYQITVILSIIFILLALTHVYIKRPIQTVTEEPTAEQSATEQPTNEITVPAEESNQ